MSLKKQDDMDHNAWLKEQDLTVIETAFLTTLIWLDKRLRIVDYLELLETMYYRANLQMPKSHTNSTTSTTSSGTGTRCTRSGHCRSSRI